MRQLGGDVEPGDYVLLLVRDSGAGMDAGTLEHIFEPFFTTKEVGKGTGMGLATVYGIVHQNRGAIRVETVPGEGTTFRIALPRAQLQPSAKSPPARPQAARGEETLLLVEDEAAVLQLSRRILERAGFTVLTARTPREAIEISARFEERVDLLVTDVMLPEMSGKELRERIQRTRPGIPCLFTSGYTADIIATRGVLEENLHFIGKPFSVDAFIAKVREVLDSRPERES